MIISFYPTQPTCSIRIDHETYVFVQWQLVYKIWHYQEGRQSKIFWKDGQR